MKRRLFSGPSVEPISLEEAKLHLRVDISDDDAYISALISTAREVVEAQYGLSFIHQTWDLVLDGWPSLEASSSLERLPSTRSPIRIPNPPLSSVVSIAYTDPSGVSQTLASDQYRVLTGSPGMIVPVYGIAWPAARPEMESISVRYVSGYSADGSLVPAMAKQALKILIGTAYENREEFVSGGTVSRVPFIDRILGAMHTGSYW